MPVPVPAVGVAVGEGKSQDADVLPPPPRGIIFDCPVLSCPALSPPNHSLILMSRWPVLIFSPMDGVPEERVRERKKDGNKDS